MNGQIVSAQLPGMKQEMDKDKTTRDKSSSEETYELPSQVFELESDKCMLRILLLHTTMVLHRSDQTLTTSMSFPVRQSQWIVRTFLAWSSKTVSRILILEMTVSVPPQPGTSLLQAPFQGVPHTMTVCNPR